MDIRLSGGHRMGFLFFYLLYPLCRVILGILLEQMMKNSLHDSSLSLDWIFFFLSICVSCWQTWREWPKIQTSKKTCMKREKSDQISLPLSYLSVFSPCDRKSIERSVDVDRKTCLSWTSNLSIDDHFCIHWRSCSCSFCSYKMTSNHIREGRQVIMQ